MSLDLGMDLEMASRGSPPRVTTIRSSWRQGPGEIRAAWLGCSFAAAAVLMMLLLLGLLSNSFGQELVFFGLRGQHHEDQCDIMRCLMQGGRKNRFRLGIGCCSGRTRPNEKIYSPGEIRQIPRPKRKPSAIRSFVHQQRSDVSSQDLSRRAAPDRVLQPPPSSLLVPEAPSQLGDTHGVGNTEQISDLGTSLLAPEVGGQIGNAHGVDNRRQIYDLGTSLLDPMILIDTHGFDNTQQISAPGTSLLDPEVGGQLRDTHGVDDTQQISEPGRSFMESGIRLRHGDDDLDDQPYRIEHVENPFQVRGDSPNFGGGLRQRPAAPMLENYFDQDSREEEPQVMENHFGQNFLEEDKAEMENLLGRTSREEQLFQCPACFEDIQPGEKVRQIGCKIRGHGMHEECAKQWIKIREESKFAVYCPICRTTAAADEGVAPVDDIVSEGALDAEELLARRVPRNQRRALRRARSINALNQHRLRTGMPLPNALAAFLFIDPGREPEAGGRRRAPRRI